MFSAIIGDIASSHFEWNNIKTKELELFTFDYFFVILKLGLISHTYRKSLSKE